MITQKILLRYLPENKNLLPAIKSVNSEAGFISKEAIGRIARYFSISESNVFSVASFYDEINLAKIADIAIEICDGANCQTKGSDKIIEDLERIMKIKEGDAGKKMSLKKMSCVGKCLEGPVVKINGKIYIKMTTNKVVSLLQDKLGF